MINPSKLNSFLLNFTLRPEGRVLLSSGVDGLIVQWTPSGVISGSNDVRILASKLFIFL